MPCPRCDFPEAGSTECPRCGVVFAKLDRSSPPAALPPLEAAPRAFYRRFPWLDGALLVAAGVAVVILSRRVQLPPTPDAAAPAHRMTVPPATGAPPPSPPGAPEGTHSASVAPGPLPTQPPVALPASGPWEAWGLDPALTRKDAIILVSLQRRLSSRGEIEPAQLDQLEALIGRYPAVPAVRQAVEVTFDIAALLANARGRPDAVRYWERAIELLPGSSGPWLRFLLGQKARGAWKEVERVAQRGLSALPDESFLYIELSNALRQQGRDEDAADVLRRRLTNRNDPDARAALSYLEKQMQSVAGLTHRSSAHFNIRFEGQADDALGRALQQVLEEKYGMLARILDCELDQEVPVILYPTETFRAASGAPRWAGGTYSHSDGRIRIGVRDLSPGFVPLDLERTLTHELAHAFIHARSRGTAPQDINEGLAQYLSGRRLGYRLDASRAVIRDGRMTVDDFYDSALSFVEYLLDRYRQPTMNEMLKYAGEAGGVEQAFRRAYGQGYAETREEWLKHL